MAVPVLMYGSESWTVKKKYYSRIQAPEMRFLRSLLGYTKLNKIKNLEIRNKLNIFAINEKIDEFRH